MRRLAVAAAVAPLAAVVVFWGFGLAVIAWRNPADVYASAGHALFFVSFFGIPIAYIVTVCVGVPAYVLLEKFGRLTWTSVTLAATLGGALVFPLLRTRLWGGPAAGITGIPLEAALGALMGGASGFLFWWIGLRPRVSDASAA
jgi:hypothetical protein